MESDTTYSFRLKDSLLGAQMLFVAFGALVLVPILTGMSTNVALFTAGVGTLIFQICTRGKVPVFLASPSRSLRRSSMACRLGGFPRRWAAWSWPVPSMWC